MSEMIQVKIEAKKIVLDWMSSNAFIQVNKSLLRKIGDTNTILLSETIRQYERWEQKGKLQDDGSFYWVQMDCEIETGYSRSTQQRAYKDMEKRGLLKTYNKQFNIKGKDRSVRFIKLFFPAIANLMFSDDTEIIESIRNKYADLKEKNQDSKNKSKIKSMIQNEPSLNTTGVIQNESSEWVKMNHLDDSKRITSKKDSSIKKDKSIKKDLKNLSIQDEVKKLNIPSSIVEFVEKKIDRLILLHIDPLEIQILFQEYASKTGQAEFLSVLNDVLKVNHYEYGFKGYMTASLKNYLTNRSKKESVDDSKVSKPIRTEKSNIIDDLEKGVKEQSQEWTEEGRLKAARLKAKHQPHNLTDEDRKILIQAGEKIS